MAPGTTFAALIDDVRRRMAELYLRDTDITLGHLANELGTSDSALTRASQRWFGVSPRSYRGVLRGRPASARPRFTIERYWQWLRQTDAG